MNVVIENGIEDVVIENGLEEILDILEKNGFIVEEEIDKIFIRKDK